MIATNPMEPKHSWSPAKPGAGGANVNHRDHGHRCTTPFILAVQSKRTDLAFWRRFDFLDVT